MKQLLIIVLWFPVLLFGQSQFTIVEYNVENLFDTQHDSLKNDREFLPDSPRKWTRTRYWEKLNKIGQAIISCGGDSENWRLPDLVGLCEVENDTVLRDLTKRSLLHKAHYEYITTASEDVRGVDVALLYSPLSFCPVSIDTIRIRPIRGMRPTRDILHVAGELADGDTLHAFLLHAPSRFGGEPATRPFRMHVAQRLCTAIDSIRSISPNAQIIAMGDFNDYYGDASLQLIYEHDMANVSAKTEGRNGARGTYRFRGEWASLDHVLVSRNIAQNVMDCSINDAEFLLEEDTKYGGKKPKRFYNGTRYNKGVSDHLPIVLKLRKDKTAEPVGQSR